MTRGGKRENAGRKTGKTHKKVLISLPLNVAEWLESKDNKSGFIAGLVEEKMKTNEQLYDEFVSKSASMEDIAKLDIHVLENQIMDMVEVEKDGYPLDIAEKIQEYAVETLEKKAHERLDELFTEKEIDFIFSDWEDYNEHIAWLCEAPTNEIKSWLDSGINAE